MHARPQKKKKKKLRAKFGAGVRPFGSPLTATAECSGSSRQDLPPPESESESESESERRVLLTPPQRFLRGPEGNSVTLCTVEESQANWVILSPPSPIPTSQPLHNPFFFPLSKPSPPSPAGETSKSSHPSNFPPLPVLPQLSLTEGNTESKRQHVCCRLQSALNFLCFLLTPRTSTPTKTMMSDDSPTSLSDSHTLTF